MQALKKNYNRIISLTLAKRLIVFIIIAFTFELLAFPIPSLASGNDEASAETNLTDDGSFVSANLLYEKNPYIDDEIILNIETRLPINGNLSAKNAGYHVMTAYNSEPGQTDDSPCITANGFDVCKHGIEDTIAANFLKLGTKIKIPQLFGDKVFVVRDRMNARFQNRVDVWMLKRSSAMKFGIRSAKIEIIEP